MLDHEREITPDWLQREQAVGYVTYVDRFAGTLAGVRERLPYLRELGVTYLHLMPLLHARPAPNDGGYAVVDYGAVEPALGTMDDLRALASDLRAAGMALCVDLVLNHIAAEHPWARGPGLPTGRSRTARSPTRTSARCPEVFPDTAPGIFTLVRGARRWVWTTFNAYQWDLDYTNPDVFVAMADGDARRWRAVGVDVLRLDAAPFLWKRLGTNCQNQPEVHELLQAFRAAMRIAAPAVAFKAEAIVAPARPRAVPGDGQARGQGVRPRLPQRADGAAVERAGVRPGGADDEHAAGDAAGPAGRRLADLRALPRRHRLGDHARGRRRASARTPTCTGASWPTSTRASSRARSRAARASSPTRAPARRARRGTCASLAGLESAPDEVAVELAVRRVLLLYAVAFAHGGLPLIYMGDELGLLNDASYLDDPHRRDDNRWMHRPRDGLGGGGAPPRPGDRRGPAVGGPAAADRGAPRDPRDPRPGRRRADLDRQRPRLRPLPRAGRRAAARAGELHRRPRSRSALGVPRPRLRADRARRAEPTAAPLEAYQDFVVLAPYQHLWFTPRRLPTG